MQVEFLKGLGLSDEVIAKIQTENGKDIQKEKEKISAIEVERDNYKSQLDETKETLKSFEGIDIKDLQGKITTLTNDLASKETEYQSKIADMEFNSLIESAIGTAKGKNAKAIKALLDVDILKQSKNQAEDIKQAIMSAQKDNPYLFGEDKGNPQPGNGGNVPTFTKEDIAKMTPAEINKNWEAIQKTL